MAEINLLPEEERKSEKVDAIKGKITLVSIVVLFLTAISAFVTLAFYTFLINERKENLEVINQAVTKINTYQDVEEILVVVKDKSSNALLVLNSSKDKVKLLSDFAQLIPQDVYFTDVNVTGTEMTLNGLARTSADVAGLVSSMNSSEGKGIVSDVQLGGLVTDNTGIYKFNLTANLK